MPIAESCNISTSAKILYPDLVNLYGCTLGQNVFVGPFVEIQKDRYPVANNDNWKLETTIVEDDVGIGSGAVIMCGITLGRGCNIGAGAVVTHDVPPGATVAGVPARNMSDSSPQT